MSKLSPFIFINQIRMPFVFNGGGTRVLVPAQRDRKAYIGVLRRRKPSENAAHRKKVHFWMETLYMSW